MLVKFETPVQVLETIEKSIQGFESTFIVKEINLFGANGSLETIWIFVTLGPAGKKAELKFRVMIDSDAGKSVSDPGTAVNHDGKLLKLNIRLLPPVFEILNATVPVLLQSLMFCIIEFVETLITGAGNVVALRQTNVSTSLLKICIVSRNVPTVCPLKVTTTSANTPGSR